MKLTDILYFIPGVQIPFMVMKHIKGTRELEESWQGYQSALRWEHLSKIEDLQSRRESVTGTEAAEIDRQLGHYRSLYTNSLMP